MELQYQKLENGIRLIKLIGKLDNDGVKAVESNFILHCAGSRVKVIVDLSALESLAAIGSELLTWTAREVGSSGGRIVIVDPISTVEQVLDRDGIKKWAPIHSRLDTAISYLMTEDVNRILSS